MVTVAPESVIRVTVPPTADVLHLLRTVTASIGARMMMSLDDVEELRIAVDEAASILLDRADPPEGVLELVLTCDDRSLRASVSIGELPTIADDEVRASWPWRVITAITDDANLLRADGTMTITFEKSAPGPDR